ncbi:hypothetical protein P7C70_g9236, partial [Phenoliferia sp. Uapishka_3]
MAGFEDEPSQPGILHQYGINIFDRSSSPVPEPPSHPAHHLDPQSSAALAVIKSEYASSPPFAGVSAFEAEDLESEGALEVGSGSDDFFEESQRWTPPNSDGDVDLQDITSVRSGKEESPDAPAGPETQIPQIDRLANLYPDFGLNPVEERAQENARVSALIDDSQNKPEAEESRRICAEVARRQAARISAVAEERRVRDARRRWQQYRLESIDDIQSELEKWRSLVGDDVEFYNQGFLVEAMARDLTTRVS